MEQSVLYIVFLIIGLILGIILTISSKSEDYLKGHKDGYILKSEEEYKKYKNLHK
mgnify:FL=1